MATHSLKTWPEYYEEIVHDKKSFEIRRNDRGFAVGDCLFLEEWDPKTVRYTGRDAQRRVTYVLDKHEGLVDGFVIMGIERYGE